MVGVRLLGGCAMAAVAGDIEISDPESESLERDHLVTESSLVDVVNPGTCPRGAFIR